VEQAVPVAAAAPAAPKPSTPESNPLAADASSSVQLPPPEMPSATAAPAAAAPAPRASGNVWATKGSAHLIQAEKEPVPPPPAPVVEEPEIVTPPSPARVEQLPTESLGPTLETGLPTWADPEPASEPTPAPQAMEMPIPTPPSPVPEPEPIVERAVPEAVVSPVLVRPPASPAAQKVLNMGRWDTGGGDDTDNIDFGFGSFGAVADTNTNDIVQQVVNKEPTLSTAGTSVSPARPPPGLSIGGMPPMPASAVMVHELENKLEGASLNAKNITAAEQGPVPGTQAPQQMNAMGHNALPSGLTQQNYNQQQLHQQQQLMPGMYNYNAAGGGFMQPVLAGMPQQQPGKPGIGGPQGSLPQQGLYGNQAPQSVPSSAAGNSSRADSSTNDNTTATGAAPTAGGPPGMPSTIPYANPALNNPALHYGAQHAAAVQHQQQFYALGGHQQQGIGYNYGYAGHAQQFGGAVQGGFGYPQMMGQSGGYGASHYDDQGHQGNSHQSGGYQNKSGGGGGGYRGRNAHGNNQYQNQYNPQQHGGYGGQPYGMGYHGHAQGGMGDPYAAMQQQQQQHQQHGGIHSGGVGGFQDDDHQKGRKDGRGGNNNSSLQGQFQQQQGGPPQLGGQGQSFGLQGQQQQQGGGIDSAPSSGGGWSNQAAGGGWSGSAAQSGGWQGS